MFLGKGVFYPIALEAALKLRELSYRHAQGFAAGELKHGSLALIEPGYPVVAIGLNIESREKLIGNLQEIRARGGKLLGSFLRMIRK